MLAPERLRHRELGKLVGSSISDGLRGQFRRWTQQAIRSLAELALATLLCTYPGPIFPRWLVAHVLSMAAVELCNPIAHVVLMKATDGAFHFVRVSRRAR